MRTAFLAALVTLGQLGLFISAAPGRTLGERYVSGFQWDSVWYADIAQRGYVSTIPPVPNGVLSNVTHFPAYPIAIRAVKAFGFGDRVAALLVAQLCTWGFWMYVLMALNRWSVDSLAAAFVVIAIAAHPTAFFLVTAYSEAMFVMTAFGLWFWSLQRGTLAAGLLSAAHGFVLTATRITGIGAVAAVLIDAAAGFASGRNSGRALVRGVLIGVGSLSGALLFFAFCGWKFGAWNFYQIRQTVGWGHRFDALAAFYPSSYRLFVPNWHSEAQLGTFENPYVLAAIIIYASVWTRQRATPESGPLVMMAIAILYLTIGGLYHTRFPAMARYQFPIHAMVVMGYTDILRAARHTPPWLRGMSAAFLFVLAVASLRLQEDLAAIFARGLPVL